MTCARFMSTCPVCTRDIQVGSRIAPSYQRDEALASASWTLRLPRVVEANIRTHASGGARLRPQWAHEDCAGVFHRGVYLLDRHRPWHRQPPLTMVGLADDAWTSAWVDRHECEVGPVSEEAQLFLASLAAPRKAQHVVDDVELTSQHALAAVYAAAAVVGGKHPAKEQNVGMRFARLFTGTKPGQCMGSGCGATLTSEDKDHALCNKCWDKAFPASQESGTFSDAPTDTAASEDDE